MSDRLHAIEILRAGTWSGASDTAALRHDQRAPKGLRFQTVAGQQVSADLGGTRRVQVGDAFRLNDGQIVEVVAAAQDLRAVSGDLARLAWHIGHAQAACRIEATRLLIVPNAALEELLRGLGATLQPVYELFVPEPEPAGIALPDVAASGAASGKRHVRFHVSRLHDTDDDDVPDVPAANA